MKKLNLLRLFNNINIPLLIFLVFFLNVKFVVKLFAIVFMIIYHKNLLFGFSLKKSRLPLFYLLIILIEIIKYLLITHDYSLNYSLVFCMGILQWAMCILAIHYIKLNIDQNYISTTHNTIKLFFLLNFLVSLFFLLILLIHPSWLSFWGHAPDVSFSNPSAGDTILGISFDVSTVNATINCIGLIYFLYKKEYLFGFLSILTVVLCTSNVTFFLTTGILVLMIVTVRQKRLRIAVILSVLSLILLYSAYSSKNREYIRNYFVQLYITNKDQSLILDTQVYHLRVGDSIITLRNVVEIKSTNPDSIYSFSNKKLEKAIGNFISLKEFKENDSGFVDIPEDIYETRPGKFISFVQTYFYLKSNLKHLLFGSGIGDFSSKLAFRASGVNALGTYPEKYKHTSQDFRNNHLRTYLFYKHADASKHSVLNYPFSVYNQILGEYGLIGAIIFAIFYLGYFISKYHRLSYGRYLIIILLGFFLMEYWFEFFSLIIIFELLMLLNIKEGREIIVPAPK